MTPPPRLLQVRHLGVCDYTSVWRDMQDFTARRGAESLDELWLLEHRAVFTLGMNAKPEHVLAAGDIPVVSVDRGGQVTYHGPGQMVAYVMMDLRRQGIGIRRLVEVLEQSVIDWLAAQGIAARSRRDAPGVYVDDAKIAALGLRVRHGCSYHGLSLNVDMDLEPCLTLKPSAAILASSTYTPGASRRDLAAIPCAASQSITDCSRTSTRRRIPIPRLRRSIIT